MINVETESLIPFNELPCHLPKRNGKKLNLSTLYRWKTNGLCGVKLEVIYSGGIPHSSLEAIRRFDEAVTLAKSGNSPKPASDKQVATAHAKAMKRLAGMRGAK